MQIDLLGYSVEGDVFETLWSIEQHTTSCPHGAHTHTTTYHYDTCYVMLVTVCEGS